MSSEGAPAHRPARGLVAVGDSITRGSGDSMLGVRMQSWALWLAEALALPYTCLAADGDRVHDALLSQVPRLQGPYDLGCVYIGVNDVRTPGWDAHAFRSDLERVVTALVSQSRAQLLLQLPPAIGCPPAPTAAIEAANVAIAQTAESHGAITFALSSLHGRELVLPDAVHLTARGEAHLALLAVRALKAAGFEAEERPLREALEPLSVRARVRYAVSAGGLAQLRDWRRRAIEGTQRVRSR